MKTKSILLTVTIFLLSAMTLFPQAGQKMTFGVQAGFNMQNLNGKDVAGDKLENSLAPGLSAGVNVLIPVAPDFYFQPGLQFSKKGAKNTVSIVTVNTNIYYLELPLNLLYRSQLGEGYILLGFGPYLGYGVKGKVVTGDVEVDVEFKAKVESGGPITTVYMKALDAEPGFMQATKRPSVCISS